MLSMKNLVFNERPVRKLTKQCVSSSMIKEIVSVRIHPVVNVSRVVEYKELVKEQRVEEPKLVEANDDKEQKMEKILNKRIVQGYIKYLVRQKGFIVEYNIWKREEDLKNAKEVVAEFKKRLRAKFRRQEKIDRVKDRNFRREELPEKYIVKILYK